MEIKVRSTPAGCAVGFLLLLAVVLPVSEVQAAQLVLRWTDNSSNEEGFLVERQGPDGLYRQVAVLEPEASAYVDSGLISGTSYCYRVRTFNAFGVSSFSNEACGTARLVGQGEPRLFTAPGFGGGPHVRSFTGSGEVGPIEFMAYAPQFSGGVFLATTVLDGAHALITGAGVGGGPHVQGFGLNGMSNGISFMAYDPSVLTGVRVAAGDVDGDGRPEIITAPGAGSGPHVRVWKVDGTTVQEQIGFFAYDPGFLGGVSVAAADVDNDGRAEVITGAGAGGSPHVRVWQISGAAVVEMAGFFAYSPDFSGGVLVGAGDVDNDGRAELVTAPGAGGGSHVRVWHLAPGEAAEQTGFFAFPDFQGGMSVAVGDVDGDGIAEIVTGAGPGGGPHVQTFSLVGLTAIPRLSFFAYDTGFTGGVVVTAPAP